MESFHLDRPREIDGEPSAETLCGTATLKCQENDISAQIYFVKLKSWEWDTDVVIIVLSYFIYPLKTRLSISLADSNY